MKKNLYVTTAIPYANAKPHIGNAMDYLLADIWKRYQEQLGKTVRFQVGTDEHGNKIAAKAQEAGLSPEDFTNQTVVHFKNLADKVGAEYTDFIRTTDTHHIQAVQYIWQKLQPYIYKGTYDGWYCVGHEAFFSDKDVEETGGICPDHQTQYEKISEENYYLKASAFSDKISEAIQNNRMQIAPEFRKKEFMELIKEGLKDVSISRPKKSLSWGVPVPNDPEQIMYVWIDALANYITVIGYPDNEDWKNYWPADIQVIGKDILRFHAGIWPAMLLALELPLPKKLLVHGFVNVGGEKISKTVGNVIDPVEIIDSYGVDAFRYFFARHIPTQDDGDFTWEKFETAYNTELSNDLGNLVQRVASMVNRYQSGVIGDINRGEHDIQLFRNAMEDIEFNRALDEIWVSIRAANKYLENVKPWEIAKKRDTDPESADHLSQILNTSAGTLLQIAELLRPFMPTTAEKIAATFSEGVVRDHGALFPRIYLHTEDPRAPKAVTPTPDTPQSTD